MKSNRGDVNAGMKWVFVEIVHVDMVQRCGFKNGLLPPPSESNSVLIKRNSNAIPASS